MGDIYEDVEDAHPLGVDGANEPSSNAKWGDPEFRVVYLQEDQLGGALPMLGNLFMKTHNPSSAFKIWWLIYVNLDCTLVYFGLVYKCILFLKLVSASLLHVGGVTFHLHMLWVRYICLTFGRWVKYHSILVTHAWFANISLKCTNQDWVALCHLKMPSYGPIMYVTLH